MALINPGRRYRFHDGRCRLREPSRLAECLERKRHPYVELAAMQTPTSYHLLLNARSGSATADTADELRRAFEEHGHSVTIDSDDETPLADRATRAAESPADVIVAAGGDGTVTAVAEAVLVTEKILAILPLGTANLLARDLGLPLDSAQWIEQLATMAVRKIDVGEVNGRIFLHKVVIGTIPGIAAAREQIRDRSDFGAVLGFLGHFIRRLERAKAMAVEITLSTGDKRVERVQSLAVVNNDYDEGLGQVFSRSCLDAGRLSLYVIRHLSFGDVIRLSAEMLLGNWRNDEAIEIDQVRDVSIRMKRPLIKAMIDGEIGSLDTPLNFHIRPCALSVLAPIPAVQTDNAEQPPSARAAPA